MSFTAIVLDEESRKACIAVALEMGSLTDAESAICHHVTLAMGQPMGFKIGSERNLIVTHVGGIGGKVSAFLVEGAEDSRNDNPHITIQTFNGAKPRLSNEIVEWFPVEKFTISGKVEICD